MPLNLLAIGRTADLAEQLGDCPDSRGDCPDFRPSENGTVPFRDAAPEGTALRWIIHHALAAAVVSCPAGSFQPLSHAAILTAIHRQIDILPVRFGMILPEDRAVQTFLDSHGRALGEALDRLLGASEMGLRIELPRFIAPADRNIIVDPAHGATPPAQYLARRKRQYQWQDCVCAQAQQVVEDYVQALRGLYRDWRRLANSPFGLVRLAFLVERDCLNAFRDRLAHGPTAPVGKHCTLLGPWPPYSFM